MELVSDVGRAHTLLQPPRQPVSVRKAATVFMSETGQLLRRTTILRTKSRQEFLPRICEAHIMNLLFTEESTAE
jgi:hypothetical protein